MHQCNLLSKTVICKAALAGGLLCVEALEEALDRYGNPEIFNTDQGSQFTGMAFTGVLLREKIAISMDGRGKHPARAAVGD